MTHLSERLIDFVFKELSDAEMEEARLHIASCAECHAEVQRFEHTRSVLKTSTDVEPPRNIVFEVEKPRAIWRWLVPAAVAAILAVVVLIGPLSVQWRDSQLTIAFGKVVPASAPSIPQVTAPAVVQPVDYARIQREITDSQQTWILGELKKRDAAQTKQIRQLQDFLSYMEAKQRTIEARGIENTSTLQYLAQRSGEQ